MLEKGKLVLYRRWICAKFFVRAASDSFQSSFGLSQCEREGECKRILLLLSRERERASERARERERSNANTNICMSNYLSSATVRSFFRLCEALQYFWAKTFNILPSSIPLKLERNTLWRRCN